MPSRFGISINAVGGRNKFVSVQMPSWMKIRLKPTVETNLKLVLDFLRQAALRLQKKGVDQWQNWIDPAAEDLAWIKEGFESKEFFLVVNEKEEVLGAIRIMSKDLLYWGEQAEEALYIHSLIILEKYAGQGIGKQVIEQVRNQANALGYPWLRLDCNSANPALCRYYESQGFLQVGIREFEDFSCNLYQRST